MNNLPIEINQDIALSLHPYYVRNICNVSKRGRNECDAWTYQALQKWIIPNKSVSELQQMFPVLYFNDVVYLALVFNPIPESKQYFDSLTLFYHACGGNHPHPEEFITYSNSFENNEDRGRILESVALIAYKFRRLDVINYFMNLVQTIEYRGILAMILIMAEMKNRLNISPRAVEYILEYDDYADDGISFSVIETALEFYPLFDYEEMIEITILESRVTDIIETQPFNADYIEYTVTGVWDMGPIRHRESYTYICSQVGVDRINQLLNMYDLPNTEAIIFEFGEHLMNSRELQKTLGVGVIDITPYITSNGLITIPEDTRYINSVTLYNNNDLVKDIIPDDKLGMYYVTSGDFGSYIGWLRDKEREILPLDYHYAGINRFRRISLDIDLLKASVNFGIDVSFDHTPLLEYLTEYNYNIDL